MRTIYGYIAITIIGTVLAFCLVAILRPVVQDLLAKPTALLVSPK